MEFEINYRTRVSIKWNDLRIIHEKYFNHYTGNWGYVPCMAKEWGLEITSKKNVHEQFTYFFKVVDKQKFMLAKIKYGI